MKKIIVILTICVTVFVGCEEAQQYPGFNVIDPLDAIYPAADLLLPDHSADAKTNYLKRIVEFKTQPLKKGEIILLGNGLIELGGNWAARLGAPTARNRGITNDLTYGVLQRLKEITYYQPSYVFVEVGIEDLTISKFSASYVAEQIVEIVRLINKESSSTKIYVNTIFPTNSTNLVAKIREANTLLQTKSLTEPFTLIDTYAVFSEPSGLIKNIYTTDGIHLTEVGYQLWVSKLAPILGTTPPVVVPPAPSNVAISRPVTVSGTENATTTGDKAVDGDLATLWSSAASFSQTLAVELSGPHDISKVVVNWEGGSSNHYATAFNIEASDNGTTWRVIASVTGNADNTSYVVDTFTGNKVAKYVRFVGQGRRSTYYRIREFEVHGVPQ